MSRFACAALLVVCLAPTPAFAQDQEPATQAPSVTAPAAPVPAPRPSLLETRAAKRPAALIPLYATFVALQVGDFATTHRALSSGAGYEANPVMGRVAGNTGALLAVKAGASVGAIWAGEKLWKKNRVGAVVFMAAINGAMAAVVAHNYAVK